VANRSAYLPTMIALASAAFGVVAPLAWNSAITALVKQIFGTGGQIVSLFIYAIIMTIVAVIVMVNLGRWLSARPSRNRSRTKLGVLARPVAYAKDADQRF
jgi:hypothetical protein